MKTVIYGAKGIALGAYYAIKELFPSYEILCFLVTNIEGNPDYLDGIPVRELNKFASEYSKDEKGNIQVLIATPESEMEDIEQGLENYGFYNYVRLNSDRWADLQKNAFIKNGRFMPLEAFPVGSSPSNLHVYKAKCYSDKKLKSRFIDPYYIIPIQAGAAQTYMRISDVLDNVGDNISHKNANYSELTVLYWIWKNCLADYKYGKEDYFGLVQYRRILNLSEDDLLRLKDNDIDVVLPYPMPYVPDIGEHHKRYLSDLEWNAVLQALNEYSPDYAEALKMIQQQNYFYNYNIIIAKWYVLKEYCSWLFPLLFQIEKINDPNGNKKPNRYMGYVGETLETLYFMHNEQHLRIAHAGCKFLV